MSWLSIINIFGT